MLQNMENMDDGEISVSPYDTAWVALVEEISGGGGPQFPTSLEWIANNQLADGSWGDRKFLISLLFSLEGMEGLVWHKLLKLRFEEGSFLSSPSSTAYALHHTKEESCLRYPVDLFEHLWSVDRLQRLGISRYFQLEIEQCINYVHRYWTQKGICWARNGNVEDVDDTSMGFRLLRLHGYDVSIDAFRQFEKGGEFCCIPGQSTHAITGMYNMYRASQLMLPGENILVDARNYSAKFLHQKRLNNALVDKWIITKDLPGEVGYALDVPFYASLPRLEARFYIEQYGGDDDVWIGKTLYRMLYVSCDTYLELAKLDYKNCQAVHQLEWKSIQKWYGDCNLKEFGLSKRSLLLAYYIAASNAFEPERSGVRLA